jgi:hypothetical protein
MRRIGISIALLSCGIASCSSPTVRDCPEGALDSEVEIREAAMRFLNMDAIAAQSSRFWISRIQCEWSLTVTRIGAPPSSGVSLLIDEQGTVRFDNAD